MTTIPEDIDKTAEALMSEMWACLGTPEKVKCILCKALLAERTRAAVTVAEPVAWQWRSRINGGAWDAWENGRYRQQVPPFMEVEERPLYAAPPLASAPDGGGWRTIDTADKESGPVELGIVRNGVLEEIHIGFYAFAYNEDEESCWWSKQADDEIVPTHWRPFAPPALAGKDGA